MVNDGLAPRKLQCGTRGGIGDLGGNGAIGEGQVPRKAFDAAPFQDRGALHVYAGAVLKAHALVRLIGSSAGDVQLLRRCGNEAARNIDGCRGRHRPDHVLGDQQRVRCGEREVRVLQIAGIRSNGEHAARDVDQLSEAVGLACVGCGVLGLGLEA